MLSADDLASAELHLRRGFAGALLVPDDTAPMPGCGGRYDRSCCLNRSTSAGHQRPSIEYDLFRENVPISDAIFLAGSLQCRFDRGPVVMNDISFIPDSFDFAKRS